MADKKTSKDGTIHNRYFVAKGDHVVKQGEKGNTAYLIQSGRCRVYAENNGKTIELGKLEAGDIFGEMALIVDEPRTASVQAMENSNFIIISRPMMIERLAKTDPLIKALVPMLLKRIKDANNSALNKKENPDDFVEALQTIYQNIHAGLGVKQQRSLERSVKPQMDAFLKTVADFRKVYEC